MVESTCGTIGRDVSCEQTGPRGLLYMPLLRIGYRGRDTLHCVHNRLAHLTMTESRKAFVDREGDCADRASR